MKQNNKNTTGKNKISSKEQSHTSALDEEIRLNRFIANSGICSRREADELIKIGAIRVNGKVVTALGTKVKPTDRVMYGNQRIKPEKHIYILLNKPKDYVADVNKTGKNKKTILHLIANACKEEVFPVGRLDKQTTGLLMLTNDSGLAKKLTNPKGKIKKLYHITLSKAFRKEDFEKLKKGIKIDKIFVKPSALSYVGKNQKEIGLELTNDRNRIVRRIMEHLGYRIVKLDRVMFAGLTKKNLQRGKYRFLTEKEINLLKMLPD